MWLEAWEMVKWVDGNLDDQQTGGQTLAGIHRQRYTHHSATYQNFQII